MERIRSKKGGEQFDISYYLLYTHSSVIAIVICTVGNRKQLQDKLASHLGSIHISRIHIRVCCLIPVKGTLSPREKKIIYERCHLPEHRFKILSCPPFTPKLADLAENVRLEGAEK